MDLLGEVSEPSRATGGRVVNVELRCADCQREADHALDDARLVLAASGDPRQLEPDLSRVVMWRLIADELHTDEGTRRP